MALDPEWSKQGAHFCAVSNKPELALIPEVLELKALYSGSIADMKAYEAWEQTKVCNTQACSDAAITAESASLLSKVEERMDQFGRELLRLIKNASASLRKKLNWSKSVSWKFQPRNPVKKLRGTTRRCIKRIAPVRKICHRMHPSSFFRHLRRDGVVHRRWREELQRHCSPV